MPFFFFIIWIFVCNEIQVNLAHTVHSCFGLGEHRKYSELQELFHAVLCAILKELNFETKRCWESAVFGSASQNISFVFLTLRFVGYPHFYCHCEVFLHIFVSNCKRFVLTRYVISSGIEIWCSDERHDYFCHSLQVKFASPRAWLNVKDCFIIWMRTCEGFACLQMHLTCTS